MNKMIPSRNSTHSKDVTNSGNGSAAEGGQEGEGEGFGVGSTYGATLNERPNKSINRNNGIDRPSANTGMIPAVAKGSRKTGRVSG